ncbi:MAG: hypothetical protein LJE69_09355 [Thiohalocapsa sp.]|jgi:hypothetical protein|uniref:hypothetical protein n=1 Tax=Thiohalocapsa sp. TaxID=2497641 RepID=UPI002600F509|nr:hypothetical protein [Thiohalocapsa sp.]MCG6941444.1 hypothetical protein [Thiohalocapsa sp.]
MKKATRPVIALMTMFGMASLHAEPVCLSAFDGDVLYEINVGENIADTDIGPSITGRVSGNLAPCAGLGAWPFEGSWLLLGDTVAVAFRAMTVDALGCGAVDTMMVMDSASYEGTLELYNSRSDFANTSTVQKIDCPLDMELGGSGSASGNGDLIDLFGNPFQ